VHHLRAVGWKGTSDNSLIGIPWPELIYQQLAAASSDLAEFERDLIQDRVKSGLTAARARGVVLGRHVGQRPSDKRRRKCLRNTRRALSYRLIGRNLGLSKNTVMEIVKRAPG
jgi:putative DNA-invertase from lambdoid prophage Rac